MGIKVLIADDSELLRTNLKKLLAHIDRIDRIVESSDYPSTIALIKNEYPDVIILDLQMPGGTGFDVLEYIRDLNINPVVAVFTNFPTEQNRKKSLALGAKYFLDKSGEFQKVIEVVEDL